MGKRRPRHVMAGLIKNNRKIFAGKKIADIIRIWRKE